MELLSRVTRGLQSKVALAGRNAAAPQRAATLPPAPDCPVPTFAFDGFDRFQEWKQAKARRLAAQWQVENALGVAMQEQPLQFHCEVHGGMTRWQATSPQVNWREELLCESCRLNARVRFCLGRLRELCPPQGHVYLTEQATFAYVAARALFARVTGSEYMPDEAAREALAGYVRSITGDPLQSINHQDLTALTMPSASLDGIGCFDVLEHVPDYRSAIAEMARVLKPGGSLVLTAPFLLEERETLVRARLEDDGSITHLLEPEYHGDPVADGGVLCFYHFGWDLLDALRDGGFSSTRVVRGWAPGFGYFGDISAIVATR